MRSLRLACVIAFAVCGTAHAQQGDAARGEQKFTECAACHSVESGVNNVGPSLAGIFGRKAGAQTDFRYSAAISSIIICASRKRRSHATNRKSRNGSSANISSYFRIALLDFC